MENDKLYSRLQSEKFIISGPCALENYDVVMKIAEKIKTFSEKYDFSYIFKGSFDKANRTSIKSYRGPGLDEGLKILSKVKTELELPVTTDVHEPNQASVVGEIVDIIQIPAFLCRQTDLLVSSAKTNRIINIKKAQFIGGEGMQYPAQKITDSGNKKVMLTERGTMFGLGNLIVDFRQIIEMKKLNFPVILDVTHSLQKPGSLGSATGGQSYYANALTAVGNALKVNGYFFETHPEPNSALSDGPNMIDLSKIETTIKIALGIESY